MAYAKGGVLEALDKAKQQGKTRFVGFTGHKSPAVHLRMIQLGYPFDTVQMPLNPFDATFHSFERQVLPEVNKRGMAALGMKSFRGNRRIDRARPGQAQELLRIQRHMNTCRYAVTASAALELPRRAASGLEGGARLRAHD